MTIYESEDLQEWEDERAHFGMAPFDGTVGDDETAYTGYTGHTGHTGHTGYTGYTGYTYGTGLDDSKATRRLSVSAKDLVSDNYHYSARARLTKGLAKGLTKGNKKK